MVDEVVPERFLPTVVYDLVVDDDVGVSAVLRAVVGVLAQQSQDLREELEAL